MTLGKYCQISGEKKKPSQVIAEAHGVVVTAPALMSRLYGDPSAGPEEVRAMVKYCARCGALQPMPLAERCVTCGSALYAEVAQSDLEKAGEPAGPGPRIIAFITDLGIIALLAGLAITGVRMAEPLFADPARESIPLWHLGLIGFLLIFVAYHTLFTALFGRTPGKAATRIRVVLKDGGHRIGFPRSLLRSVLYLFTLYVVPIGLVPLLFQEPPSSWLKLIEVHGLFHNPLTDTVVIKPRP